MWLPLLVVGERPFIDGEFANVREDYDAIIKWSNKEALTKDRSVTGGECQIEMVPQV